MVYTGRVSLGSCSNIRACINAAVNSVMLPLYVRYAFCDIVCKLKSTNFIASESAPPIKKFWVGACLSFL